MVAQAASRDLNAIVGLPVQLEEDLLEVGGLRDEVDQGCRAAVFTSASIAVSGAVSRTWVPSAAARPDPVQAGEPRRRRSARRT